VRKGKEYGTRRAKNTKAEVAEGKTSDGREL
jgi:hypothetical protein